MKENNNIGFFLSEIKTDQFALFEENKIDTKKVELNTNLSFGYNSKDHIFIVSSKFVFRSLEKPFISIEVSCYFKVDPLAIKGFTQNNKTTFPKGFVAHMAMLTVGATRGVLHAKTSGSELNKYFLPTINVSNLVAEDIVFDN